MDYYSILGVTDNASDSQIKSAYRRLVKLYHPDVNPSSEAQLKIRDITIAYEILSDPNARSQYDLQRYYGQSTSYQHVPKEPSPEDVYRKEYRKKKAAEEQRRLELLFKIKTKFYSLQRICCFVFIGISLVFSIDYFYSSKQITEITQSVKLRKYGNSYETKVVTQNFNFSTSPELFDNYDQRRKPYLQIYYSSVFDVPSQVGVLTGNKITKYSIYGTLHTFGNFFSYILFLICAVVVNKRRYADWALTLAIVPFFIVAFLLAFVVTI